MNSTSSKKSRKSSSLDALAQHQKEMGMHDRLEFSEEIELGTKVQVGLAAEEKLATAGLSKEERKECERAIEEGFYAKEKMVQANLRLVFSLAQKFAKPGVDLDELIAEGNKGLLRAVEKYDPQRGIPFGKYAPSWIRNHLLAYTHKASYQVNVPDYLCPLFRRVQKAHSSLFDQLGRMPSAEEVLVELNDRREPGKPEETLSQVEHVMRISQPVLRLDAKASDQDSDGVDLGMYFGETLASSVEREGYLLSSIDHSAAVQKILGQLTESEATIVSLYFGLGDEEPLSNEAIGKRLGLTGEAIRQAKNKALERIKNSGSLEDPRD